MNIKYAHSIELKVRSYVLEYLDEMASKCKLTVNSLIREILENYVDNEIKNGNSKERKSEDIEGWQKTKSFNINTRIKKAASEKGGAAISTIIQKSKSAKYNKDTVISEIDSMIALGELIKIEITHPRTGRITYRYKSIF